jgi:hypothetical protein
MEFGIYIYIYVCMYIYIYIYLLTPWSRVHLEKLTVNFDASQEIPRIIYIYIYTHMYIYIYIIYIQWRPLIIIADNLLFLSKSVVPKHSI